MATVLETTEQTKTILLHIATGEDHVLRQQIVTITSDKDGEHRFDSAVLQQFHVSTGNQSIALNAAAMDALCDAWLAKQGKIAVECNTDKPIATCDCVDCQHNATGDQPRYNVLADPLFEPLFRQ